MLNRIFRSAITAYVLLVAFVVIGQVTVHRSEQRDIARNCMATQHEWDTFQHLIAAAVNPPSRAGQPLTQEQVNALAVYRGTLTKSIGERPDC